MCRNIKRLHNYDPPASEAQICDAALQYVRKIAGFTKPSQQNEAIFMQAVNNITLETAALLAQLKTSAPKRNMEHDIETHRQRQKKRFANSPA
jgi:hypothetical protein